MLESWSDSQLSFTLEGGVLDRQMASEISTLGIMDISDAFLVCNYKHQVVFEIPAYRNK
jgi:hypothetical protein